ncbi:hypothetical protein ACIRBX_01130 [Kitasatospora sp. NPDC096147]|uniref:hypothetical protein n=1 Tax=Kitasatospora sp. NPDC096147 TaxID=3364093 RepID=UPI0038170907
MTRLRVPRPAALATAAATALLLLGPVPLAAAAPTELPLTSRLLPIPAGALHSFTKGLNGNGTIVGEYYQDGSTGPLAIRWDVGHPGRPGLPGYARLAPLAGERFSTTTALSDAGWVVGHSYDSASSLHPVRWAPGGTLPSRLALPGGSPGGHAADVNDHGVVVGDVYGADSRPRPQRWQPDGRRIQLPLPPGDGSGTVTSVNNAGTAVGWAERDAAGSPARPVRWNAAGAVSTLPLPAGIVGARTSEITDNGVILGLGRSAGSTEYDHVLVWAADGTVRDAGRGRVYDVNRAATAVGASLEGDPNGAPTRWNANGTRTTLANPAEAAGEVLGVNNRGTAVGYAWPPAGNPALDKALLWKPDGTVVPLPAGPLGPYGAAFSVNDAGLIAGFAVGTDATGAPNTWRATVWKR